MNRKKIYLIALMIILFAAFIADARDNSPVKNKFNKKEPIEITSDKMDAYNETKMVVFSGHAVAKQGDVVLQTDKLTLYYKKEAVKKEKIGPKGIEGTGDLDRIEAKGNVVVTQLKRIATGDEAVYYQDTGQIVMTGNPVLKENRNTVKGCKVIIYLNEDRGTVERCEGKQVWMEVYPEDEDEVKK